MIHASLCVRLSDYMCARDTFALFHLLVTLLTRARVHGPVSILSIACAMLSPGNASVEAADKAGLTILIAIAREGDTKLLEFLVDDCSANLEAKTQQGE